MVRISEFRKFLDTLEYEYDSSWGTRWGLFKYGNEHCIRDLREEHIQKKTVIVATWPDGILDTWEDDYNCFKEWVEDQKARMIIEWFDRQK